MPGPGSCHARPGVALLLVIAALAVLAPLAASLTMRAAHGAADRSLRDDEARCSAMLRAADDPISAWLDHKSQHIVLPPASEVPSVAVLRDRMLLDGAPVELRVTAFDQLGMPPLTHAELSDHDVAGPSRMDQPTADTAVVALDTIAARWPNALVYPDHADIPAARFGDLAWPDAQSGAIPRGSRTNLAFGARYATHNPPRVPGASSPHQSPDVLRPALNVNTAPRRMLEPALRATSVEAIGQIMAARAEGRPAVPPRAGDIADGPESGARARSRTRFVGSSSVWAFRVDATSGGTTVARWRIYVMHDGEWREVQRLAIED